MRWWQKYKGSLRGQSGNIRFIWGFPVEVSKDEVNSDSRIDKQITSKPPTNKGVAMIIAIMAASMMMLFSVDLILNSSVSLQLASSARNNLKAEYLAKSGLNLATFLVSLDLALDVFKSTPAGGNAKPSDGRESMDIWAIINQLPPLGGDTAEMLESVQSEFGLSQLNDAGVFEQLKLFDGQFMTSISDESSRININNCAIGRGEACTVPLKGLLSCPAEAEFLSKKNLEAPAIIANIKDWADNKTSVTEGAADSTEEAPYEDRRPKVSPKNDRYDSLDELKLISGWDDDLHKVFSPYLTVYPLPDLGDSRKAPRINFNTASLDFLSCLLKSYEKCPEKSYSFFQKDKEDIEGQETASSSGQIASYIGKYFCNSDKKANKIFTFRTDTFRVKVDATVGDQSKQLVAVIYRYIPSAKQQEFSNATYQMLYWKML
tara:strand:- start:2572 stop:3870 length:1299 start_codon:yes stop_codon:yes gene_type:complete